jgi:WD domain, G-beta repeat
MVRRANNNNSDYYNDLDFDDNIHIDNDTDTDEERVNDTYTTGNRNHTDLKDDEIDDDGDDDYDTDEDADFHNEQLSSLIELSITTSKKCVLGGPITAVIFIPTRGSSISMGNTCPNWNSDIHCQYDFLYGQGSYLHYESHELLWIQQQQQQQQQETSHPTKQRNRSILVFTNGNSIHGIRHCHWEAPVPISNQQQPLQRQLDILLIFGGRYITFLGRNCEGQRTAQQPKQHEAIQPFFQFPIKDVTADNNNNNNNVRNDHPSANEHTKHRSDNHKQQHYTTTFEDWIWDCRFIVHHHQQQHQKVSTSVQQQRQLKLIVGLAHQQLEICYLQIIMPRKDDDSDVKDWHCHIKLHLHRIQAIVNNAIPKCISYCMDLWTPMPSSSMHRQPIMIASGTVTNKICIWLISLQQSDEDVAVTDDEWNQNEITDQYYCTQKYALLGEHEGVIHALKFHKSGQYLVSISDDRTVRLWECNASATNTPTKMRRHVDQCTSQWILKWTAYGHTARGWDVTFCDLSTTTTCETATTNTNNETNSDCILACTVVLSTGEDSTLRIWDAITGDALVTLRGHSCQCIWRVATIESDQYNIGQENSGVNGMPSLLAGFAATGGNNGTVAFYKVGDTMTSSWWKRQAHEKDTATTDGILSAQAEGSWQLTYLIPDDDYDNGKTMLDHLEAPKSDTTALNACPTLKKSKKGSQQVVVGMKFTKMYYPLVDPSYNRAFSMSLIIATRSGSVWDLNIHTGSWTKLEPWRQTHKRPSSANDHTSSWNDTTSLSDGCCMSLHPDLPIMVIGTVNGDIVVSQMLLRGLNDNVSTPSRENLQYTMILPGQSLRSVQNLKWMRPNVLLSFHIQSIVLWSFSGLCHQEEFNDGSFSLGSLNEYTSLTLCVGIKGLAICSALNDDQSRLVVGDTRGNLTVFNITLRNNVYEDTILPVDPTSAVRECHRKEHITDVLWKDRNTIVSVGNDGHICTCVVDSQNNLIKLLSVPVGSFTGISRVWNISMDNMPMIVVGGYFGNSFAIVDVSSGYEFFRVDTGGRQRAIDICMSDYMVNQSRMPDSIAVATFMNRHDGHNEINVHWRGDVLINEARCYPTLIQNSVGIPMHGESIFDIHLFPIDTKRQTMAILTGSEDCSAKITIYSDDRVLNSTLLPPQVSGIRAVYSCRFDATSTVVVLGGKNAVELFLVNDFDPLSMDEVVVRYVGRGKPVEKLSIDHRINCVRSAMLFSDNVFPDGGPIVLVVSGDSNGSCYFYLFSRSFAACDNVKYETERPILALDILPHNPNSSNQNESCLIFVGGTSGDVLILSLLQYESSSVTGDTLIIPLMSFNAHSIGTNSIAAKRITSSCASDFMVRICSCGDDQAICCTDVTIFLGGIGDAVEAYIDVTSRVNEASLSALKGIEMISDNLFAVTGYDQRLSFWRYDEDLPMVKVYETPINVGDVNCFSKCTFGGTRRRRQLIAVGGAGVEIVSLQLHHPAFI